MLAPTKLNIYSKGGHEYGLRRKDLPETGWPELVDIWLKTIGEVG
jgi:hypothetical protein